jgi:hypothetical protein
MGDSPAHFCLSIRDSAACGVADGTRWALQAARIEDLLAAVDAKLVATGFGGAATLLCFDEDFEEWVAPSSIDEVPGAPAVATIKLQLVDRPPPEGAQSGDGDSTGAPEPEPLPDASEARDHEGGDWQGPPPPNARASLARVEEQRELLASLERREAGARVLAKQQVLRGGSGSGASAGAGQDPPGLAKQLDGVLERHAEDIDRAKAVASGKLQQLRDVDDETKEAAYALKDKIAADLKKTGLLEDARRCEKGVRLSLVHPLLHTKVD